MLFKNRFYVNCLSQKLFRVKSKITHDVTFRTCLRVGGCNATYYGKTKRCFKVRIGDHLGISHLTEKKVKIDNNKLTAIQEHLLCCNYSSSFEDFSILTMESNDFKLKIMESLLIACNKPILNKADSSLPLELF